MQHCSISATLLSTVGYDRIVRSAKNARLDEYSNSRAQVRVFLLTACPAKFRLQYACIRRRALLRLISPRDWTTSQR